MPLSDAELEIAGRLKYFRESQKIKQIRIAEGSKTKQGQLSEMEQGKKQIQPRVILFLARRYNLNVDWLFTGRGDMFIPSGPEDVGEAPVKYQRASVAQLEARVKDLEARLAKMEATNSRKGK